LFSTASASGSTYVSEGASAIPAAMVAMGRYQSALPGGRAAAGPGRAAPGPGLAESWRSLALLKRQGWLAEAVEVCRVGLEHHPQDVALWVKHGVYRVGLGDLAGAEAALLRGLELAPDGAEAVLERPPPRLPAPCPPGSAGDCPGPSCVLAGHVPQ
jgi:hypothetical protein